MTIQDDVKRDLKRSRLHGNEGVTMPDPHEILTELVEYAQTHLDPSTSQVEAAIPVAELHQEVIGKLKYYLKDILELLSLRGCDYDTETLEEYPRVRQARLFLTELEALKCTHQK